MSSTINRWLDGATNRDLSDRRFEFDDDLSGKTVANSTFCEIAAIAFTDGTWCGAKAESDCCDGADLVHVYDLNLCDLRNLKLITEEQFAVAKQRQLAHEREQKQKQIAAMQAELDRETSYLASINALPPTNAAFPESRDA